MDIFNSPLTKTERLSRATKTQKCLCTHKHTHTHEGLPEAVVEGLLSGHHADVHRAVLPDAIVGQHLAREEGTPQHKVTQQACFKLSSADGIQQRPLLSEHLRGPR